jgi:hypothetical protein
MEEEGHPERRHGRGRVWRFRVEERGAVAIEEVLIPRDLPVIARLPGRLLRDRADLERSVGLIDLKLSEVARLGRLDGLHTDDLNVTCNSSSRGLNVRGFFRPSSG